MKIIQDLLWSLRLDYVLLFRVPGIPFSQKMYLILIKYVMYLKQRPFGLHSIPSAVTILGKRYFYDDLRGIASLQRVYCEHYLLKNHVPKDAVVIDVGANIGQFNFFARHYLQASRVLSIEPIESCFNVLKLNSGEPENCFHCAIGDENADLTIFVSRVSSQLSTSIKNPHEVYDNSFKIKSMKMKEILRGYKPGGVHVLKIDTEGSEYDVLVSAGECLNRVRVITVEMSVFRPSTGNIFKTGAFLERQGFELAALNPSDECGSATIEGIFINTASRSESANREY
jgi:FkbM family methyltransferase